MTNKLFAISSLIIIWGGLIIGCKSSSPANHQFELDSALTYLRSHCLEDGLSETLVIRNGDTLFSGEFIDRAHNIYSCTKSITSTIVGLMIADGLIQLDEPLSETIPELSEYYPNATYKHFITMTSGYNATGENRWGESSEDWSKTPFVATTPLFEPGTAYCYWDEAMMTLGKALTIKLNETLKDYFDRKVAKEIGWGDWSWWATDTLDNGLPINNGCTGININAKQMSLFAKLYLQNGQWNGKQLIPSEWITHASQVQVPSSIPVADTDRKSADGSGKYGYNWWVFDPDQEHPVHAYYASGLNHNVCMIVPEWDLIFIRMGNDKNPAAGKHRVYGEILNILAQS